MIFSRVFLRPAPRISDSYPGIPGLSSIFASLVKKSLESGSARDRGHDQRVVRVYLAVNLPQVRHAPRHVPADSGKARVINAIVRKQGGVLLKAIGQLVGAGLLQDFCVDLPRDQLGHEHAIAAALQRVEQAPGVARDILLEYHRKKIVRVDIRPGRSTRASPAPFLRPRVIAPPFPSDGSCMR